MKLLPGKASYSIPKIGKLVNIVVSDPKRSGLFMVLSAMEMPDLIKVRAATRERWCGSEARNLPRFYALAPTGDRLELYPVPDKPYDCRIRYYPPIEES